MSRLLCGFIGLAAIFLCIGLAVGSMSNPDLWFTADQRGQKLETAGKHELASKTYNDPMRRGAALYRAGCAG